MVLRVFAGALLAALVSAGAAAGIGFTVSFEDSGEFDPYRSLLEQNVLAAGAWWDSAVVGDGVIDVMVRANHAIPRATAGSATSVFYEQRGRFEVREEGMAFEIRTGIDPNGASPDVFININPDYLANTLWLDPDGYARTAPVPSNRTDAMSVMIHELGHGIGFNGWADNFDGTLPGSVMSRFDQWKVFDGSNLFFSGPEATDLYGGPVPLTFGNANHIANASPRPGSDLLPDLMNGVVFSSGTRYEISPIDLAILRDLGLETVNASPQSDDTVLGDSYDLQLQAFYYDTVDGWVWGESIGEGGVIGGLTFGEASSFTLLGNELVVDSEAVAIDESTERWTFTLTAADGGEVYDPSDPGAWRAMHLRELGVGDFGGPDAGLTSANLEGTAGGAAAQRIEFYADGVLVETADLQATADGGVTSPSGELRLEQSLGNPGVILFDDGVFSAGDLGVTEIRLVSEVSVVASTLAGNYNGDGVIDAADYDAWVAQYGMAVTPGSGADGNGDGIVDAADYTVWRAAVAGVTASNSAAVPEPGACVLALGASVAILCRRPSTPRR